MICGGYTAYEEENNLDTVSVIMPTYNCGDYITTAVRSVINQTYPHWELIIVDDASTDNTATVLRPLLTDTRIHYVRLDRNRGAAAARTLALQKARGRFMAFLDSDDAWLPQKLEEQLAFMYAHPGCAMSATAYRDINEHGEELSRIRIPPRECGYWKLLFLSDPLGNSTVIYDRTVFGDRAVPPIEKRNDFALWLSLLRNGEICRGLPTVLTHYRVRSQSLSARKLTLAKYHWHLYREIEGLPIATSALAMTCWAVVKGWRQVTSR